MSCVPRQDNTTPSTDLTLDTTGLGHWQTGRCEHTLSFVAPHYLFVVGGFSTAGPQVNVVDTAFLGDVQVLDLSTRQWLPIAVADRLFLPRGAHSAVVVNDDSVRGGAFSSLLLPSIHSTSRVPRFTSMAATTTPIRPLPN